MNFFKKILYKLIEDDLEEIIEDRVRENASIPEGLKPYKLKIVHEITSEETFDINIEKFNLEGKNLKINEEHIIVDGVVIGKYNSLFKPEDNVVIIISGDADTVNSNEDVLICGDVFKGADAGGDIAIGGNMNGDINCSENVVVQGNHSGNIEADKSVIIEGSNEGNIDFGNKVDIKGSHRGQISNCDEVYII